LVKLFVANETIGFGYLKMGQGGRVSAEPGAFFPVILVGAVSL